MLGEPRYTPADLEDPSINIRYGTFYLSKLRERFDGNWPQAVAALSVASRLEPGDAELKVSLAWAEIMAGDNEAALSTTLAALDQNAADPAAHEARLTALLKLERIEEMIAAYRATQDSLGSRTAAQTCLERVRTLNPDHPAWADLQERIEALEDDAPR